VHVVVVGATGNVGTSVALLIRRTRVEQDVTYRDLERPQHADLHDPAPSPSPPPRA